MATRITKFEISPLISALIIAATILIGAGLYYLNYLRIAHLSFGNYFIFRGCEQLLEKTDTFGVCKSSNGQTIKIVEYQGRWFLDGDLPCSSGLCW